MKNTLPLSLAAACVLGFMSFPAGAAPAPQHGSVIAGEQNLVQDVRMKRRKSMRRSAADKSNAGRPARRPGAQNYGNTSGGPAR